MVLVAEVVETAVREALGGVREEAARRAEVLQARMWAESNDTIFIVVDEL